MIRPATPFDATAIKAMIHAQHARSKYAGRVGISKMALNEIIQGLYSGLHQSGPCGTFLAVAVKDGKVVGFIAGALNRVYHIGDRMAAQDMFFVNEGGRIADTLGLLAAYVEWAKGNKRVLEIMVSWSDALPGAERIAKLYARQGFERVGEMWEMRLDAAQAAEPEGIAA